MVGACKFDVLFGPSGAEGCARAICLVLVSLLGTSAVEGGSISIPKKSQDPEENEVATF